MSKKKKSKKTLSLHLGRNQENSRGTIFLFIVLLVYGLLAGRLFYLQVINGEKYLKLSEQNRIKLKRIVGYRGKIYDRNGKLLVSNSAGYRLLYLKGRKYDDQILSDIEKLTGYDKKVIEKRIKYGEIYSYTKENLILDDISKEKAYNILEKISNYPYLKVESYAKRKYVYDDLASHILGYVKKINAKEYEKLKDKGYTKRDTVGKTGIEKSYELELKGEDGYQYIEVNALNRIVRTLDKKKSKSGGDIRLTIDYDLQKYMTDYFKEKNLTGSFLALDPKTGEILTIVSYPEYSLNTYSSIMTQKQYNELLNDERKPLTNRIMSGVYPPGSIFKPISAIAFMEKGLSPSATVFDPGFYQIGKWKWRSWKRTGHGRTNLEKSLIESVNTYYYKYAHQFGYDPIYKVADAFGLGKKTGIDISGERGGLLPSKRWKKSKLKESWYPGDTIIASIGQGYTLVTLLQMAKVYSFLANRGFAYTPHLLKDIEYSNGSTKEYTSEKEVLDYKKKYFDVIAKSLEKTVSAPNGTVKALRTKDVKVAAKTGSAQNAHYDETHAWVAGFFPVKDPEIVFVTLVEGGGGGGSTSGPVAKAFVDKYLELKKDRK